MAADGGDDDEALQPYIKSISLQNFMCHQNFEITLGKRLNLIYGTNGSGKSTILTALMVALGSRASTTSRSESLGSFVKTGSTKAYIHVKIHVPAAYKNIYAKYGEEVTITRVIGVKGDSSYQLRDAFGKRIPKAGVKDVRIICHHFGIYPDNELAMLSQENAKEFLVHATDRRKYDKLQKALLHNVITKNQEEVEALEVEQQEMLVKIKQREQNLEIQDAHCQEVLSRASEQSSRMQQMKTLKNIVAWRDVDKEQDKYDSLNEDLEREREELARISFMEGSESLDAQITTESEALVELSERQDRLQSQITEAERESQDVHYTIARSREDLKVYEEQLRNYTAEIEANKLRQRDNSPEKLEKRRKEHEASLEDANTKRTDALEAKNRTEQRCDELRQQQLRTQEKVKQCAAEEAEITQKIRSLEDELKSGGVSTTLRNPFHEKHKQLQRLVASQPAGSWEAKPMGPLYESIKVKDEGANYTPALERLWNNTLDCWWVQTDQDRTKLLRLARQIQFHNLQIILRRDDAFDFANALPPSSTHYKRLVDTMNVKSDAIKRILVDMHQIEGCILVEGTKAAFENVKFDRRIINAIAISRSHVGQFQFTQVSQTASRTDTTPIRPHDFVRISIGTEALQNQLHSEIAGQKAQLNRARDRTKAQQTQLGAITAEIEGLEREIMKLNNKIRRYDDDISTLSAEILRLETGYHTEDYASEISRLDSLIKKAETDIKQTQEALTDSQQLFDENENMCSELRMAREEASEAVNLKRREVQDLEKKKQRMNSMNQQQMHKQARKEARIRKLESELRALALLVSDLSEKATESYGERVVNGDPIDQELEAILGKDSDEIESMIRKLQAESQVVAATPQEIERAEEESKKLAELRIQIENNRKEMEELVSLIESRRQLRQVNQDTAWERIKTRIESYFVKILRRRKFSGHVSIDDKHKKFVIEAAPEINANRTVSTLSGGEKSFTQIALLMSVWEAMQVGLVAMDEYDVFMDKSNRSMSLMFLAETISHHRMQCILITPQDVDTSALEGTEFTMHKLNPAR